MKRRALAVVLTLMMIVSVLPMAAFAAHFSDTVGHWAESSIDRWTDEGVLQGVGDDMFLPNAFITRAQAAAVFTRLLQLQKTVDVSIYNDVEAGSWYEEYVSHAVAHSIMNGTSATTFNPDGYITRQDFFLTFARAVGIPEQATCNYTGFVDLNQLSDYAKGEVYALINLDYVHGRSATELQPLAYITRAEVAKILDNVIAYYITEDGEYQVNGDGIAVVLGDKVSLKGNYSGTVVAAKENGTVDLGGVANPVNVNAVEDNVNVEKAPVGSRVTAKPGVKGTTYTTPSGKQETVDPSDTEVVKEETPAPSGGPSGPSHTYKYALKLDLKIGGFASTPTITYTPDADKSAKDALYALADGDNVSTMINSFLGEMDRNWNGTFSGSNYSVTIVGGKITVTKDSVVQDLGVFLGTEDAVYTNKMATIKADRIPTDCQDEWDAFVACLQPSNLLTDNHDKTISFKTGDQYEVILDDSLKALGDLVEALQDADATGTFDYNGLFNAIVAPGTDDTLNLNKMLQGKKSTDKVLAANVGDVIKVSEYIDSIPTAVAAIDARLSREYQNNDIAQAILASGLDSSSHLLKGTSSLTLSVVRK